MKPSKNCRWCIHSTMHDIDWFYCDEYEFFVGGAKARAHRNCPKYEASWCPADRMDQQSDQEIHKRELALYKRRMAGDWS